MEPGDLVIGDGDGGMVLPRRDVATVLDQCEAKVASENRRLKEITEGEPISPWVDEAMRAAGILGAGDFGRR